MKHPSVIIGLTGPNASGKGTVAEILKELGFAYHSLSDQVRKEALARGLTTSREDLIRVGNLLRETDGPGALAKRVLSELGRRDTVDSIRNPGEVQTLRDGLSNFILLGVSAEPEVRYQRARRRARAGDSIGSFEEFRQKEALENSSDPKAQQLKATLQCSDRMIDNNGSLEALRKRVVGLVQELERGG